MPSRFAADAFRCIVRAALLAAITALLAACGYSSRTTAVIGPPQAELTAITVAPADASLAIGLTQQYIAIGVFNDGSRQDLSSTVTWSSGTPSVASISTAAGTNGLATALTLGSTTITAASGSIFGTAALTVTPVALVSIAVAPPATSIAFNGTQLFTATGTYSDRTTQVITTAVIWASSAASIATIDTVAGSNSLAKAVAPGTVTITATQGSVTGATTLTVNAPPIVSIAVTPASASIGVGATQQFKAVATYADKTTLDVTALAAWTSSNTAVADINHGGVFGLAAGATIGTTNISAALNGVTSNIVTLTVTPPALVSIVVTPANAVITLGATQAYIATGTYTDGSANVITNAVIWNSSVTATATIATTGIATGVAVGTTLISASLGPITSNAVTLTVVAAFAYAVNYNGGNISSVSQYTIGAKGQLSALIPATTPPAQAGSFSLVADPTGKYVYVGNYISNTVSQYTVQVDGSLLPMTPATVPTDTGPNGIAVSPTGPYVYVANYGNGGSADAGTVSQFTMDVATGNLVPMTPPTVQVGPVPLTTFPASVAVNPAGTFAYVVDYAQGATSGAVYGFSVGATGALTPLAAPATPSVPAGPLPNFVVVHPSGKFAYVANSGTGDGGNTVSQYAINADGTLTPLTPATVAAGTGNGAGPWSITIDTTGKNAYVPNHDDGNVYHFTIAPDGTLSTGTAVAAGAGPTSLAIDPSGHFAYVTDRSSPIASATIAQFLIALDGSLTPLAPATAPAGPEPAAIITVR